MVHDPIDFGRLTAGEVFNLSGHERGLAAREAFGLDVLDSDGAKHVIHVPEEIYGVSPSFVQGLFAATLKRYDNDIAVFKEHYELDATDLIRRQISRGLRNIVMDRSEPIL